MIKELLLKAIQNDSPFAENDFIELQANFFLVAGKLTQEDFDEVLLVLHPVVVEVNIVE